MRLAKAVRSPRAGSRPTTVTNACEGVRVGGAPRWGATEGSAKYCPCRTVAADQTKFCKE
ncbi:hypothetical protein GCM10018962_19700 [Dactylosporangium matsuzakiense]|uniref:Uncharacterized protein n=1 Tax=Dactylosporangium matsuzakiense TaxID=53360 RepID=A0A9W6NK18_9ACTN|nr:hypothetical protein GCM10017581_013630 [Dactylosporangium matsuzakiense]